MSKRKLKDTNTLVSTQKKSKSNGLLYCCAPGDEQMMKIYASKFYHFLENQESKSILMLLLEKLDKCVNILEALDTVESSLGFPFYNNRLLEFSNAGGRASITNLVLMCPSKLHYGLENESVTAKIVKPFIEASNGIIQLT